MPNRTRRSCAMPIIDSATVVALARTSRAGIRTVSIRRSLSHASRFRSRAGRSPVSCAKPSISIARFARAQKKSSTNGPAGCCFRNRIPCGEPRNSRHSIASGRESSRLNRRALCTDRAGLQAGPFSWFAVSSSGPSTTRCASGPPPHRKAMERIFHSSFQSQPSGSPSMTSTPLLARVSRISSEVLKSFCFRAAFRTCKL